MLPTDPAPESFSDKLKRQGRSAFGALKEPEGLATAALGAFLINPVVGLALGIGQGILARRDRQSALEEAAADRQMLQAFDEMHRQAVESVQGMASTDLDKAQLEQLTRDYLPLQQLAMHPDPAIRRDAFMKLAEMSPRIGDWLEDLEGRNEEVQKGQVGVLDAQGEVLRGNYESALERAKSVQSVAEQFHTLLADPSFDVNNPVNRARLGQLLEQTPREFLADPADMSDMLEKVGANAPGLIGGVLSYLAGKKKAEEFTFTKEDWRKIAFAMQGAAKKQSDQAFADAERGALMLDKAAGGIGYKRPISYLDSVMTGRVQEGASVAGPGVYSEIDRKAAEQRAAAAAAKEATEPSKVSKIISNVKKSVGDMITNAALATGMAHRATPEELARLKRRPTN